MSVRAYLVTENAFRYNDEGYELCNDPSSELVCPHRIFRTLEAAQAYIDQRGGAQWHWDNLHDTYSGPDLVILEVEVTEEEKLAHYEAVLASEASKESGFWYALDPDDEGTAHPEQLNVAYPSQRLEELAEFFGLRPYAIRHPYQTTDYTDPTLWEEIFQKIPPELIRPLKVGLYKARKKSTDTESLLRTFNYLEGRYLAIWNRQREDIAHLPDPFAEPPLTVPLPFQHAESPTEWARLASRIPPVRRDALRDYLNTICLGISWEAIRDSRVEYSHPGDRQPRCISPKPADVPSSPPWEIPILPAKPPGYDQDNDDKAAWEALVELVDNFAPSESHTDMSHPFFHARSSARKFGGVPEDYLAVHNWFDQTKSGWADIRHRAVLHSSFGIFLCEQVFGVTFVRPSDGKPIPTRLIGEQHVLEDLGRIPTVQDWLGELPFQDWMLGRQLDEE